MTNLCLGTFHVDIWKQEDTWQPLSFFSIYTIIYLLVTKSHVPVSHVGDVLSHQLFFWRWRPEEKLPAAALLLSDLIFLVCSSDWSFTTAPLAALKSSVSLERQRKRNVSVSSKSNLISDSCRLISVTVSRLLVMCCFPVCILFLQPFHMSLCWVRALLHLL